MKKILGVFQKMSIVQQILIGLIIGIILGMTLPGLGLSIFGQLFVAALKAVAPILVFVIVTSAIAQRKKGSKSNLKHIIGLYLLGTFLASLVAICFSFLFPTTINLVANKSDLTPMSGVGGVLRNLIMSIFTNPITAIANANYIGILAWASLLGFTLHNARPSTKEFLVDLSEGISHIIRFVIRLAPLGIMGLVYNSVTEGGLSSLKNYGQLLLVLVGCMLFIALVMNPIIVAFTIRKNPYPLVFRCLRQSGITAFFTRSSAANIPVNMTLCQEMGLKKDVYSISIPLGATINMAGAAITISVLTLAAVNTLGISVNMGTALLLSLLAAVSACGASGVAGGSLLLIPLAAGLFGISNDVAMQVVGAGFIIGVVQDSCETALNSSTDALFTISADWAQKRKLGLAYGFPDKES